MRHIGSSIEHWQVAVTRDGWIVIRGLAEIGTLGGQISPPLTMTPASNTQRMWQHTLDDDHYAEPLTEMPGRSSPSNMNISKQVVKDMTCHRLRRNLSPQRDSDEYILEILDCIWAIVKGLLKQDPKMEERLASEEEFRENVTRRGEKKFIDLLRAMAANSDTQGNKALDDLFEDGSTSFSCLWVRASDHILF